MQTIFHTSLTPEQYVKQAHHKQVKAPENCPNCSQAHTLEALMYYRRYATWLTSALIIWVRRFLCRKCQVSVSCLPSFAQPYRAINTATVSAGFSGQTQQRQVQHWGTAIKVYWQRFEAHLPELLRQVGNGFSPVPLQPTAKGFWEQLLRHCGDLARATGQLVQEFRTCLFGTYRCHQRRSLHTE